LVALEKLSKPLQSDVLADHSITRQFDVGMTVTLHIGGSLIVPRDELFDAFREANGCARPINLKVGDSAPTDVPVTLDEQGTGCVTVGSKRFLFANAALLNPNAKKRREFARRALQKYTLQSGLVMEFTRLVNGTQVTYDNVSEAMRLLSSSPEAFFSLFQEKLARANPNLGIGKDDLLPDDARYWDNLAPPPGSATTVTTYLDGVWLAEVGERLARGDGHAFAMLTPAFISPASVPHQAFSPLSADKLVEMIEPRLNDEGHFALLGIIEICAQRMGEDTRFVTLGEHALQRLFADMARLKRACALFAPIFVIATAYLAEHERFQVRPAFWRRLAAAAHATLIVRASGVTDDDYSKLLHWAIALAGNTYSLSVLTDMAEEPRWRSDWIAPNFMVADAVGRALGVLSKFPKEALPPTWQTNVAPAQAWIAENDLGPLAMFPCILEGQRRSEPTIESIPSPVAEALADFNSEPTLKRLNHLAAFCYAFGLPVETRAKVPLALNNVRHDKRNLDDRDIQLACTVASHVAVQANDVDLATLTADVVLEKLRDAKSRAAMSEAVFILVACSCANQDRQAGRQDLVQRLEHIALTFPASKVLHDLGAAIDTLSKVQPPLVPLLGRAAAAVRLGAPSRS